MNMKFFTLAVVGFAALSVLAESEDSLGRWSFSAGPSWRSQVKMSVKGQHAVKPRENLDMENSVNWAEADYMGIKVNPDAGTGTYPWGTLWSIDNARYEIIGTDEDLNSEESAMGANFRLGYDFYQSETFSIGLDVHFAAYWDITSSSKSIGSALETWTDHYIFPNNPPTLQGRPEADDTITKHHDEPTGSTLGMGGVGMARIRGDLYQIGIGPKFSWTPFAGSESSSLDWITLYGGVEALWNVSRMKFDGAASGSSTDLLPGFGGNLGILAGLTENLGLYGQVGYEWIDKAEYDIGGFKSEINYNSLVISAGLQYRF